MNWLRDRATALLDNLIWVGLVALAVAVGGSVVAFGSERANLPIWTVVLFGFVLFGCLVAMADLYRRVATLDRVPAAQPPPPHPHAALLRRIDGLAGPVAKRDQVDAADWPTAAAFNGILRDARAQVGGPVLDEIEDVKRGSEYGDGYAYSATYGTLTTLLAQVRSVVE